ncbi:MAG: alanine dehydrogenase [Baekduia sp.]
MRVGVVKEIKPSERRVALTPAGVSALRQAGHQVLVEAGAGMGSGHADDHYLTAGGRLADADTVWSDSELVLKVKEPTPDEHHQLRDGLILFAFLHLAAEPQLASALCRQGTTAVAYETIEDAAGRLPLLAPMSEIAGRLAAQAGAHHLEAPHGGPGVLIGGAPGVEPARVLVLGGGAVGANAARVASGMGANVTLLETSLGRVRELEMQFGHGARVLANDPEVLAAKLSGADLVIGAVLIPGARAPRLITRKSLGQMRPGSVLVDVAIDQGGCAETSRPTTHLDPVYAVDGILHYCVANMPGAVPATSTRALTNATLPYVLRLADHGTGALDGDAGFAKGLNVSGGQIVSEPVAAALAA